MIFFIINKESDGFYLHLCSDCWARYIEPLIDSNWVLAKQ